MAKETDLEYEGITWDNQVVLVEHFKRELLVYKQDNSNGNQREC